jgi:hypothetical protein
MKVKPIVYYGAKQQIKYHFAAILDVCFLLLFNIMKGF